LQRKHTQEGRIEEATAIQEYRDRLKSSLPAAPVQAPPPAPAPVPAVPLEKDLEGFYASDALARRIDEFEGQEVLVIGTIRKLERDRMSRTTLMLELEGGLFARIPFQPFYRTGQKIEIQERQMGDPGLYINQRRVLQTAERIALRGVVKKEMNRWILDQTAILKASHSLVAGTLGIPSF